MLHGGGRGGGGGAHGCRKGVGYPDFSDHYSLPELVSQHNCGTLKHLDEEECCSFYSCTGHSGVDYTTYLEFLSTGFPYC